jgi:hypothetical protein
MCYTGASNVSSVCAERMGASWIMFLSCCGLRSASLGDPHSLCSSAFTDNDPVHAYIGKRYNQSIVADTLNELACARHIVHTSTRGVRG